MFFINFKRKWESVNMYSFLFFEIFCFIQSISKHIGFLNVFDRFQEKIRNLLKCIAFCIFFEIFCFIQSISKHIGFLNVFDQFQEKMRNLSECIAFCVFSKFSVLFNPFQNILNFLMFLIDFKRKYIIFVSFRIFLFYSIHFKTYRIS